MSKVVLGVDIGTSSSKGVLVSPDGILVGSASRSHELSLPRPGWAEHDPEKTWWSDFAGICQELIGQTSETIAGVGVSGIGPCLLPVDEAFRPLRAAILYGIDTRATREIGELTERFGADDILNRGGSLLTSQALGPKLAWLRRNEPHVWAKTRRFLMASSFIVHRLTQEYVLDHSSASQCNPLYDIRAERWNHEWASEIAGGLLLPRLVWPGDVVGNVTTQAAEATGIPTGTPVVAGTIDAWAEALSVGVRNPGDTMLMYGTTMFLIQVAADPQPTASLWTTSGIFPHSRTLAAGLATSGAITQWIRTITGGPSFETLVSEAELIVPGSEGLVLLPYFAGERSPIFDPAARGLIVGLTLRHQRAHLYRAVLEGTAFSVRHNLDVMDASGARPRRLVAVGGGTQGGLWTQIVSDVTGYEQELPKETIGASFGDALLAAIGVGLVPATVAWNQVGSLLQPNPAVAHTYDQLYSVFRGLYEQNAHSMHALSSIAEG